MENMMKSIKQLPDFFALSGVSEEQICAAEHELQTHFSNDYREYLALYGLASVNGHELTGLCTSPRLNVINVTKETAEHHIGALPGWYVVEQANIDGIVIWQSPEGTVYQTQPSTEAAVLCNCLLDYIQM